MNLFAATEGAHLEWPLLGILVAVAALFLLAYVSGVPYPIWLTAGAALLGFVPGMPDVELEPDLVLLIILPPLLGAAAYYSSVRELRRNARPISLLAIGLVIFTTFGVAAVAHLLIDGLSWQAAVVLGAVLGPTDPVAATAIAGRVGAPRRIVTVLEGESLVNDSTALIVYKFAVAAVVTGGFSLASAAGEFLVDVAGGVLIGVAAIAVFVEIFRRIEDTPTEAILTLVSPYLSYLPADALGVSGVIAVVSGGIYMGWRAPGIMSPQSRLQLNALWGLLVFVLNSVLFVLVGLQLPALVEGIDEYAPLTLAFSALLVALVVMAVRFLWVFPATYVPRRLFARVRERDPSPPWQSVFLVAFTGMRGAVSLAVALAIPETVGDGGPFPARDLIIFLTFTTILWTVIAEGLSLPYLIRFLGVRDEGAELAEEDHARLVAAQAAVRRVDELRDEEWVREDTAERVRGLYEFRQRRFRARLGKGESEEDGQADERSQNYQRLVHELLEAQRTAVLALRREGRINDETMRKIERDLDLEDARLELERSA